MATLAEIFYYVFTGAVGALTVIIFLLKQYSSIQKKRRKSASADDPSKGAVRFYLNVFVLNKKEVIKSKVQEKFGKFKILGRLAGGLAGNLVTDDAFVDKLCAQLSNIIPERLKEQIGVDAEVGVVYKIRSYFVIVVDVHHADARAIIKRKGGEQKLEIFDRIMNFAGIGEILEKPLSDQFVAVVGDRLIDELPEKMTQRLKEAAGVEVEVVARSEGDQSNYFFAVVNQLNHSSSRSDTPVITGRVSIDYDGDGWDNVGEEDAKMPNQSSTMKVGVSEGKGTEKEYAQGNNGEIAAYSSTAATDEVASKSTEKNKTSWYPGKYIRKLGERK